LGQSFANNSEYAANTVIQFRQKYGLFARISGKILKTLNSILIHFTNRISNFWNKLLKKKIKGNYSSLLVSYPMMIPFSTEKLSVGNPKIFQSLILTGSPRICVGETESEHGTPVSLQTFVHWVVCSYKSNRK